MSDPSGLRAGVERLIEKFDADGAKKDTYHATMGVGWKFCANELRALLAKHPPTPLDADEAKALQAGLEDVRAGRIHSLEEIDAELAAKEQPLRCLDCGLLYADFGLDVNVPRSQWLRIFPQEHGGVLCANCIVKRLAAVTGVTCAHLVAEVAMSPPSEPSPVEQECTCGMNPTVRTWHLPYCPKAKGLHP